MHYNGVQVSSCMMLIIQKNTMIIKQLMDTLQVPTLILQSMYGQAKLLSASALPFKRKFAVRLGRIKRFANIWESAMVDTVKHREPGSSFIAFSDNFDCVMTLYGTGLMVIRRCYHSRRVSIFSGRSCCAQTVLEFLANRTLHYSNLKVGILIADYLLMYGIVTMRSFAEPHRAASLRVDASLCSALQMEKCYNGLFLLNFQEFIA